MSPEMPFAPFRWFHGSGDGRSEVSSDVLVDVSSLEVVGAYGFLSRSASEVVFGKSTESIGKTLFACI
jgi:hypothetical protein